MKILMSCIVCDQLKSLTPRQLIEEVQRFLKHDTDPNSYAYLCADCRDKEL